MTGPDIECPEAAVVTRGQWAQRTLEAYRHLFTELATSLGGTGRATSTTTPPTTR